MDEPGTVRHAEPVNAAMFAADVAFTASRFKYLISRRDQLLDRLRFGVLALNGASIVALLSALGGDGAAASWIGFNPPRARASAIAFVCGAVLAGAAKMVDANLYRKEAGDAEARRATASLLSALYEGPFTQEHHAQIEPVMKRYHELPLVDFQYSLISIVLLNMGAGVWLFGVGLPLWAALGL